MPSFFKKRSKVDSTTRDAYLLEKALAKKLKDTGRKERSELYNVVYAEYYKRFPKHPFIVRNEDLIKFSTALQINYLKDFISPDITFMELGPGTGNLSAEIAKHVDTVYALDVSASPSMNTLLPSNVKIIVYNGIDFPVFTKPIQVVYSNQVMEHLHPDDALEQLKNIYNLLPTGGIYICRTPHRYSGPHDISKHFDDISTCFHLKEYTVSELVKLFRLAGFKNVRYEIVPKGKRLEIPLLVINIIEMMLANLPFSLRRAFARNLPLKPLFNYHIVGIKSVT